MVKRVLAIILATIISFTAVETTGLFFVSANNGENTYCTHPDDMIQHQEEQANCENDGHIEYWECPDCGKWFRDSQAQTEITEEQKTQSTGDGGILKKATGHSIDQNSVTPYQAPTCTEPGNVAYTQCTVCDDFIVVEGSLNSYTYKEELTDKDQNGEINADDAVIPARHNYNDGVVTKEATCTTDGIKTFTCQNCGSAYTKDIPATGHNYNDGIITKEATLCI